MCVLDPSTGCWERESLRRRRLLVQFAFHLQLYATGNRSVFGADDVLARDNGSNRGLCYDGLCDGGRMKRQHETKHRDNGLRERAERLDRHRSAVVIRRIVKGNALRPRRIKIVFEGAVT